MIKIYCDTSGYQPYLKNLSSEEVIVVGYPYENKNRRIKNVLTPSALTWQQADFTWDNCIFTWDDLSASEKFNSIKSALNYSGQNTAVDAQHLDCAYKNNCQIFLTNDVIDIINNRCILEELLGIKIFNANSEEVLFKSYLINLINLKNRCGEE